jgi:hypothetical protein
MEAGIVLAVIFGALTVATVLGTVAFSGRMSVVKKLGVLDQAPPHHSDDHFIETVSGEELASGRRSPENSLQPSVSGGEPSSTRSREVNQGHTDMDRAALPYEPPHRSSSQVTTREEESPSMGSEE